MKFDAAIPSPAQAGADAPATFRFTFEQGPFAGKTFSAMLDVCLNPCCPCGAIAFQCEPLPASDAISLGGAIVPTHVDFDLDVLERNLNTHVKSSSAAVALGRAVVAELQPPDWEALADFFMATKRHQMETMDLATVSAEFPPEAMAGSGSMVGYVEVFPWADLWDFEFGADCWLADDQYCVRPGCGCTQTALTFFRLPKGTPSWRDKVKPEISLRYDYVSRATELIEARLRHPAAGELMQTLRAAYPVFGETLRERHRQLKQLGRRLLRKSRRRPRRVSPPWEDFELDAAAESSRLQPPAPQTVRAVMRPGRNDPCPCGSGKKFKKCCGGAGSAAHDRQS
jgi:hypothetical protein